VNATLANYVNENPNRAGNFMNADTTSSGRTITLLRA
jgi:hypothetical protein